MSFILFWALTVLLSGTLTSLPVFIQNILNCVLKTNKAFTGLERHGGKVINDKIFILGWSNPLKLKACNQKFLLVHMYKEASARHINTYLFIYPGELNLQNWILCCMFEAFNYVWSIGATLLWVVAWGQTVSLDRAGCISLSIVQHELLHALGIHHEQNRSDRDSHVQILLKYIIPGTSY